MEQESSENRSTLDYHRKYYEEIIKEKRRQEHKIVTTAYYKARKSFRRLLKKLEISNLPRPVPPWYQELSIYQIDILNDLQNCIKDDCDGEVTTRVRCALNDYGLTTKIPHKIAKSAIFHSKLYSIDFLQYILKYLTSKIVKVSKKTEHTFEERLLLSGIVHLGLPSLFMKLAFCLDDPIVKNQPDFKQMKKIKRKKYLSPYMEPFNISEKTWHKKKKIKLHNLKVEVQRKKEKLRQNMINEQKKQQENVIHNVEMKMNSSDPIHPLCALFTKIPLDDMFECLATCKEHISEEENIEVESVINDEFEPQSNNSEVTSGLSDNFMKMPDSVKHSKKVVINENNTGLTKADVPLIQNTKIEKSDSSDNISTIFPSTMSTVSGNTGDFNSEEWRIFNSKPHEYERLKYSVSYTYDYEEVGEESELEEIIEDEDFSFLMCDRKENEDREDYLSDYDFMQNPLGSYSNNNNVDINPPKDKLNEKNVSQILEKSFMSKLMDGQSKTEEMMITMFNYQANAFPEYRLHSLRASAYVDKTLKNDPIKNYDETTDKIQSSTVKNDWSEEKTDLSLDEQRYNSSIVHEVSERLVSDKLTEKTHFYDEILAELRKLSGCDQLKAVLKFLDILGDPIAGLPKLIEFDPVKHWYESRLNTNYGCLAKKDKNELLYKSERLWGFSRPTIKKVIAPRILRQSLDKSKNGLKLKWDKKKKIMKTIKKTEEKYMKGIKNQVLNGTRQTYPSFKTMDYQSKLNREFKKTYHCYFPAREKDFTFTR